MIISQFAHALGLVNPVGCIFTVHSTQFNSLFELKRYNKYIPNLIFSFPTESY